MWLGCLVFALISLPIGFLMRFLPVPEVCCIPMLAGGKPNTLEIVDDVIVVDEATAEHDGDLPRSTRKTAVVVVADTPIVGKASHWDKARRSLRSLACPDPRAAGARGAHRSQRRQCAASLEAQAGAKELKRLGVTKNRNSVTSHSF